MPSAGFSAKNARVNIGAKNLSATKWTVNVKTDELDISNFETATPGSNLYADYTFGLQEAEVSVDAVWDGNNDPHSDPPNITAGGVLTNLKLYLDFVNLTNFWLFPSFQIFTVSVDADVRGIVKYSFTGKNKGTFSYP